MSVDPTPPPPGDAGRFRELIEKTADGVLVVAADGSLVYANPAAEALLGRSRADLEGAAFGTPVVPGETTEIDLRPGTPGAGMRVAEMRVASVVWDGRPAALASLRDVTERKRMADTVRFLSDAGVVLAGSLDVAKTVESAAALAVQHLADWCLIDLLDEPAEGDAPRVTRFAAHRPGEPPDLLAGFQGGPVPLPGEAAGVARVLRAGGTEVFDRLAPADVSALALAPAQAAALGRLAPRSAFVVPMTARGRTLGAITFLSTRPWRAYSDAEQALGRSLADRAALAVANARLYDASREAVQRRDEFLAMLAHELRNPLAPILHAARLMTMHGPLAEPLERLRATIDRQGHHLARLLDDLLDLSRVNHGKIDLRRGPTDLAAVVADAVQVSRAGVEARRHHLAIDVRRSPLVVHGDPTRLAQIVGNLLNNAARYTDPGGRISLRVFADEGEAVLTVADTGRGIPPDMLTRIFEPFTQINPGLDRAEGGLGIGLAMVRRLVELHDGTVRAFSAGPGRGSAFEVRLPLSAEAPRPADNGPVAPVRPRRVLLVEDNLDGRDMLGDLLRIWGHSVTAVGDGYLGLNQIQRELPDVALIDIGLPGLDGYRLARKVRQLDGGDRVTLIAVTGYGLPEDRRLALEAGFDEHLVKPVDLNALARLLDGRAALPAR